VVSGGNVDPDLLKRLVAPSDQLRADSSTSSGQA
jgi:hypothetical protein